LLAGGDRRSTLTRTAAMLEQRTGCVIGLAVSVPHAFAGVIGPGIS
jgi:hypothetical protein